MDMQMNELFPVFSLSKTPAFDKNASLVLETPEAYVYKMN